MPLEIGSMDANVRVQTFTTKPRPCGNYFPTCTNFHISHVGILLIRIGLEFTDVILHFALKARLGGEPTVFYNHA